MPIKPYATPTLEAGSEYTPSELLACYESNQIGKALIRYVIESNLTNVAFEDIRQQNTATLKRIFNDFVRVTKVCPDTQLLRYKSYLVLYEYVLENSEHSERRRFNIERKIKDLKKKLSGQVRRTTPLIVWGGFRDCSNLEPVKEFDFEQPDNYATEYHKIEVPNSGSPEPSNFWEVSFVDFLEKTDRYSDVLETVWFGGRELVQRLYFEYRTLAAEIEMNVPSYHECIGSLLLRAENEIPDSELENPVMLSA